MALQSLEASLKFKSLLKRINLPKPYIRGLLETWWDVAHYTGKIRFTREELEVASEWEGNPGEWADAMIALRWVDQVGDDLFEIHSYWEHAPTFVKDRRRKAEMRGCRENVRDNPRHSEKVPLREEKRGEEKRDNTLVEPQADSTPQPEYSDAFKAFWNAYPRPGRRRSGRDKCYSVWKKQGFESKAQAIMVALSKWKRYPEWTKDEGEFVPGAHIWLKDGRWKEAD